MVAFWSWTGWNALVAFGTIGLAVATVVLAFKTSAEITESRRVRRLDAERAKIDRVYEEVLRLHAAAVRQVGSSNFDVEALPVAQLRVRSAIQLAGGPELWPQTDLMAREGLGPVQVTSQAAGALLEITEAFDRLANDQEA